ncbi:DUF1622 domain-containing protein [Patescibacteria group bacterium]|nr:DUF1622 domain-containing protein [Patescibacteria group bacterium]
MIRELLQNSTLISIIQVIGIMIEYIGLAFVAGAVCIALFKLPMKEYNMEEVRAGLAKKIIFGLEFIIAADIILATVATDIGDILRLGGIVLIRIMLGYALRKEIME